MKESLLLKNTKTKQKLLFIGVGNGSRGDDALGWEFVSRVTPNFPDAEVEYKYQLQVEDSALFSEFQTIIIADASHKDYPEGFDFKLSNPAPHYYFSSHAQHPETVLHITQQVFHAFPAVYVMAISGYQWELTDQISTKAGENLKNAIDHFLGEFTGKHAEAKAIFT